MTRKAKNEMEKLAFAHADKIALNEHAGAEIMSHFKSGYEAGEKAGYELACKELEEQYQDFDVDHGLRKYLAKRLRKLKSGEEKE